MSDAFAVLGLSPDSSDEAIRQRYLELVRLHSPERDPARFAAIRQAYEQLQSWQVRLNQRLFEAGGRDSVTRIIEEWACRKPRRRISLKTLLEATRGL